MKSCAVKLFILFLMIAQNGHSQNWPMVNHDKERTSWAADESFLYPPFEKTNIYRIQSAGSKFNELSFADGLLSMTVQNEPNIIQVVETSTGDMVWTFKIPESRGGVGFTAAHNDSLIFAGGQQGQRLFALDRDTGLPRWSKAIGSLYSRNIVLDGDVGYLMGDSLYSLNISDGSTNWAHSTSFQGTPAVDENYVYTVGLYEIRIFDKLDGSLVWQKSNSHRVAGSIMVDEQCFYTTSNDTVYAFDKNSREIKWAYHSPGDELQYTDQNACAMTHNKLCFTVRTNANQQGKIVTLDKATGAFIWEHAFDGEFVFAPVIANGVVYAVTFGERALYGFNIANGEPLFHDNSAPYRAQPIVANHSLFAVADSIVVEFANASADVSDKTTHHPDGYALLQNYPNPFNAATTIRFILPKAAFVTLTLYDNTGRELQTVVRQNYVKGQHRINFEATDLASGVYFYKIHAGNFHDTKKFLLLK